jgi:hypothetical protein
MGADGAASEPPEDAAGRRLAATALRRTARFTFRLARRTLRFTTRRVRRAVRRATDRRRATLRLTRRTFRFAVRLTRRAAERRRIDFFLAAIGFLRKMKGLTHDVTFGDAVLSR